MAKKLIIETQVNTESVDKAQKKLGELKDLGRGLKIQYNIDGKPIDVVIDKSKNLQQQVKILTAELRKTKEGTAEFQLLSSKLGEAQDGLAKTTAKSKDLFTSLSMIPGPVGQFFSQLQGGIELLKTFSSFTFKDLKFQFKETADDIADIGKNLGDVDSSAIDKVEKSSSELGDTLQETAAEVGGTSAALSNLSTNSKKVVDASGNVTTAAQNAAAAMSKQGQTIAGMTAAQAANVNVTMKATAATNQLAASEATATVATNTLGAAIKGALIGTGIGIAIVLIGELVSKLIDYFDNSKKAEKAANDFSDAIKRQNEILEANLNQLDFESKKKLLQAKIAGKSEKELNDITQQGLEDRYNLIRNANSAALLEQQNLAKRIGIYAKISDEERAALLEKNLENLKKLGDEESRAREAVELNKLQIQATAAEKTRALLIKANKDVTNDNQKANDLLLKLQQENSVNKLNEERKRQDAQLKIDKENEEREINNLKLSKDKEDLRAKLLEQVRVKYGIKVIELNKKRQEEDNKSFDESQKKIKEYQDKVFEIMNNADENEFSRSKAARTKKFNNDVKALQDDANFQKQSLEDKIRILLALEKEYQRELKKIDDDEVASKEEAQQKIRDKNLKRLDDELKFLQIRSEALREGTKQFYNNQREILKTAEKRELADLADRAAKEKLSIEQIEKEKLAIKEKYLKAAKDISQQELQTILAAAQATLGVAQTIASDVAKVAQLGQQVALEEATKRYIEQNELDKKTIANQEQQAAKLLENKKKFAKEEDDIKRKAFEENKKIQIAQAIIATLQSAVGAYSSLIAVPIVGPVIAPIAAAAALIFGYKQVDLIKKTQYQSSLRLSESETPTGAKTNLGRNYAEGGLIGGKRHAEGGTLIEAEKGEAIMTRGAVATFGPLLSLMNQAGGGTSFNSNLTTTRQDNPIISNPTQEQSPLIVKTYVVSQELTTEAQRQARLKNLSTI